MLKQSNLLHIATVGKAVGLKGDMKFHDKSDFPEQFVKGASFLINEKESITLSEVNHKRGLIKIVGCTSPEDAKKYINKEIFTTHEETRKNCHLDEGQYFWFDVVGCNVFEDGKCLGSVDEVERIGATNYLSLKTDISLITDGLARTFLIPFQKPFILNTDIEKKVINASGAMGILETS